MAEVLLSLGSNVDREKHLRFALEKLSESLVGLSVSPVFESEAIGFEGDAFLNMVVLGQTELSLSALSSELKALEQACGRKPGSERYAPKVLDIDILTFDQQVGCFDGIELPRPEILYNAFVLWPLAELVPDKKHPELGVSYQQLWSCCEHLQKIEPVYFEWRGQALTANALLCSAANT